MLGKTSKVSNAKNDVPSLIVFKLCRWSLLQAQMQWLVKTPRYLWGHWALSSRVHVIIITICLFLPGTCCFAGSFSSMVDALHRAGQDAMRDEALNTVQRSIYQLCLTRLD